MVGKEKGAAAEKSWEEKFAAYAKAYPELAAEFKRRVSGELPTNWAAESKAFIENYKQIQRVLQAVKHHKMLSGLCARIT